MRNLPDSDGWMSKEADRPHKEIALWDEIGIENRDEIGVGSSQGVIDIAGLGVGIVASRWVANPLCVAELFEPRPPPIIQQPDLEIRIVKGDCAGDSLFQNLQRFIICRNMYVYPRQVFRRRGAKSGLMAVGLGVTVAGPQESEIENKRIEQREHLDDETGPHPSDLIPFACYRHNGCEQSPVEIAGDDKPHNGEHELPRPRA